MTPCAVRSSRRVAARPSFLARTAWVTSTDRHMAVLLRSGSSSGVGPYRYWAPRAHPRGRDETGARDSTGWPSAGSRAGASGGRTAPRGCRTTPVGSRTTRVGARPEAPVPRSAGSARGPVRVVGCRSGRGRSGRGRSGRGRRGADQEPQARVRQAGRVPARLPVPRGRLRGRCCGRARSPERWRRRRYPELFGNVFAREGEGLCQVATAVRTAETPATRASARPAAPGPQNGARNGRGAQMTTAHAISGVGAAHPRRATRSSTYGTCGCATAARRC